MKKLTWCAGGVFLALVSLSAGIANASRLQARVVVTQSEVPQGMTERKLIAFAKSHQAKRLMETKDAPLKQRKWLADMVVAFNVSPADSEYHALFYDVTGGNRRFVDDMAIMVSDPKQRTFLQKLKLRRSQFEPGRKYEIVVTVRRNEVGKLQFETVGEHERRSGRVDFTDEQAK